MGGSIHCSIEMHAVFFHSEEKEITFGWKWDQYYSCEKFQLLKKIELLSNFKYTGFYKYTVWGGLKMKMGLLANQLITSPWFITLRKVESDLQHSGALWKLQFQLTFLALTSVSYRMDEWMTEWVHEKCAFGHFLS